MKHGKLFSICLVLFAAVVLFALLPGQAQAATSGIYEYEIDEGEAEITYIDPSASGAITIPSTLGGYPVTRFYADLYECEKVTSVTIPASVQYLYCGCGHENLAKFIVASDSPYFWSDSSGVVYTKDKTELVQAPGGLSGSYTVPSGTESISCDVGYAFSGCTKLTSVTIPASVEEIDPYAFDYCDNLTAINVNSSNPNYSSDSRGVLFNKDKTELIKAPGGISGSYTIPNTVNRIGDYAFEACEKLTSVTVPTSVTRVGCEVFAYCDALQFNTYQNGLYLGNSSNPYYLFVQPTDYDVTSCNLHSNTKIVAAEAFAYNEDLTTISIPDGIVAIGNGAFSYCDSLQYNTYDNALYLGNSNNPYLMLITAASEDITSCKIHPDTKIIRASAFYWCEDLKSVTLHSNIKEIGDMAFYNTGLTSVVLPESLTEVGQEIFSSCDNLTSVTLGSKVTTIGAEAFYGTGLTSIKLPETVTTICYGAFQYSSLETLEIPSSVKEIQCEAFKGTDLTSVVIPGNVTSIGYEAFDCWDLDLVRFLSNAPTVNTIMSPWSEPVPYVFPDMDVTIQIPANNSTWTTSAKSKLANEANWTTAKTYAVTAGGNTTIDEVQAISVTTSVSSSNLIGVYVNGEKVRSYYYSVSGNTTVTLDSDYVAKLRNGTHTISLIFTDGEATATLTVKRVYSGDLDNNSEVNVDDAIYLLQHVLMPDMFPINAAADYNNNGAPDVDDAIYLLQHVLMPDMFPL